MSMPYKNCDSHATQDKRRAAPDSRCGEMKSAHPSRRWNGLIGESDWLFKAVLLISSYSASAAC